LSGTEIIYEDEGVVGFVATHKRPLIVENVLDEPRFKEKEMAKKLGLVSMVSVPLQVKDEKVIGVLNCFTASRYKFYTSSTFFQGNLWKVLYHIPQDSIRQNMPYRICLQD